MSVEKRSPKKIILLSDGTGNSAAKAAKTNVWRLYQALDLSSGDQLAFYDDGVGTSNQKIMRLLGGAFGFGLARNVRDLYTFLCEHYEPGDHIYVFGFSRGAFTARILVDMITSCGVLDRTGETIKFSPLNWKMFRLWGLLGAPKTLPLDTAQGLRHGVRFIHKAYRRMYTAHASNFLRWLGDKFTYKIPKPGVDDQDGKGACLKGFCHPVEEISFVGVWDTVSAYGLPIQEFTDFIDEYLFPLRFPNQNLSTKVNRARQALAIDDKRQSFQPILWNEEQSTEPDQLKQVWFSGMHSNVGGGYPNDDLAHISLEWMMDEIRVSLPQNEGLRFKVGMFRDIRNRAQATGKMHDSRSGSGMSYRYLPRDIGELCNSGHAQNSINYVRVSEPLIHSSVIERIISGTDGYAPTGLPHDFKVKQLAGPIIPLEAAPDKDRRHELHERSKHHIFWDRVNYFVLLALAAILVLAPLGFKPVKVLSTQELAEEGTVSKLWALVSNIWDSMHIPADWLQNVLTTILGYASFLLPGFAIEWLSAWIREPVLFFLLIIALFGAVAWNNLVARNIQRLSEAAWGHLNGNEGRTPIVSNVSQVEKFTARLRNCRSCAWIIQFFSAKIAPPVFTIAAVILFASVIFRVLVHIPEVDGGICNKPLALKKVVNAKSYKFVRQNNQQAPTNNEISKKQKFGKAFKFDPKNPCLQTGLVLDPDNKYKISVVVTEDWMDDIYPASPSGLQNWSDVLDPFMILAVPGRRHPLTPWMALMGEVGPDSGQAFQITGKENNLEMTFTPLVGGELVIYVNDAIYGWGVDLQKYNGPKADEWDFFYKNNNGLTEITVSDLGAVAKAN